jgi:hypothetical protein
MDLYTLTAAFLTKWLRSAERDRAHGLIDLRSSLVIQIGASSYVGAERGSMEFVKISAAAVAAGRHVPDVCVRHGEPAVARPTVTLISKPAPWTYLLILFGVLPWVIVVTMTRKTIVAPAWPWCARCAAERKRALTLGLGGLLVSVALVCVLLTIGGDAAGFSLLFLLTALVAGLYAARNNAVGISKAFASRDGQWVEAPAAHERFAAEARRLQTPSGQIPVA